MSFIETERNLLLALKGVGPTVVSRLEEVGIDSLEKLSHSTVEEITNTVAQMLRTTCWKNSPLAKAAIGRAIALAKRGAAGKWC